MRRLGVLGVVGFALLALASGGRAEHSPEGAAVDGAPAAVGHQAADEPRVTLTLRARGVRAGGGARVAITGTFRGPAPAGRRMYALAPVGDAIATHRHGPAAAQRARVERVFLDARSGRGHLRIVATGPLIGGPVIAGQSGPCRRVTIRHAVRPEAGTAVLRWACRRAGAGRSRPIHLDVVKRPRDAIASSYTLVKRPCSRAPAPASLRAHAC
jgi:hypothetical protein